MELEVRHGEACGGAIRTGTENVLPSSRYPVKYSLGGNE